MLTFDDKGGWGGQKNSKTCLRNTWMFPKHSRLIDFIQNSIACVVTFILSQDNCEQNVKACYRVPPSQAF